MTPLHLSLAHVRRAVAAAVALAVLALVVAGCAGRTSRSHEGMWGPFRGRFVDADTGEPIRGGLAYVVWFQIVPTPVQAKQQFYAVQFAVTNDSGEYEIPALPSPPVLDAWYDGPYASSAVPAHQLIETVVSGAHSLSKWRPVARISEDQRDYASSGHYTSFIPENRRIEMLQEVNAVRKQMGLPPFRTLRGGL